GSQTSPYPEFLRPAIPHVGLVLVLVRATLTACARWRVIDVVLGRDVPVIEIVERQAHVGVPIRFRQVTPMPRCRTALLALSLTVSVRHAFAQPSHERLIAVAADGSVVKIIDGDAASVVIGAALDAVLRRSDAHVRLTHNHPASNGLSGADLEQ